MGEGSAATTPEMLIESEDYACWLCRATEGSEVFLVEQMFGTLEEFAYTVCSRCESLQISSVPTDTSKYYPPDYYSLASPSVPARSLVRRLLKGRAASLVLRSPGWFARRVLPRRSTIWAALHEARATSNSRILDVGCGSGALLVNLGEYGFRQLVGIDPFAPAEINSDSIRVLRGSTEILDGPYDIVMANHVLEHISDPRYMLNELRRLCAPSGSIVVRLPVVGASWREYGRDWIELDPPRHLFIPTMAGLRALIQSSEGLRLESVRFDTYEFELIGSELLRRGRHIGRMNGDPAAQFSGSELRAFRRRASQMNHNRNGGRVVLHLRRIGAGSSDVPPVA